MTRSSDEEDFDYNALFGPVYPQLQPERKLSNEGRTSPPTELIVSKTLLRSSPSQAPNDAANDHIAAFDITGKDSRSSPPSTCESQSPKIEPADRVSSLQTSPRTDDCNDQLDSLSIAGTAQTTHGSDSRSATPDAPAQQAAKLWVVVLDERPFQPDRAAILKVVGSFSDAFAAQSAAWQFVMNHFSQVSRMREVRNVASTEEMQQIADPGIFWNIHKEHAIAFRINSGFAWARVWTQSMALD